MRGLTRREAQLLRKHAPGAPEAHIPEEEDPELDLLVQRGLLRTWTTAWVSNDPTPDGDDPDEWETIWWETTPIGAQLLTWCGL